MHMACIAIVSQVGGQDLIAQPALELLALHGKEHLDTMVQVSSHQVCAAEIDLLLTAVFEIEDPAVLQESADDARNADVLAKSRQPWSQAADSTDEEVDPDPRA